MNSWYDDSSKILLDDDSSKVLSYYTSSVDISLGQMTSNKRERGELCCVEKKSLIFFIQ